MKNAEDILKAVQAGSLNVDQAIQKLQTSSFHNLGHSRVDLDRRRRKGVAEVVYGEGKTAEQIQSIVSALLAGEQNVLVTRLSAEKAEQLLKVFTDASYHAEARVFTIQRQEVELATSRIAIACAGTSDFPVAEEARVTAEFLGNPVDTLYDAGVAGLHRLMADVDTLLDAKVVVAVAGMEGALPSVVGGLVKAPVIAVPTSVGYGASFGGVAALLGMLNSCSSGVSVVNIDNGFGAGYLANTINRL
ncbi:nickel pincer cofactor biosynthesis protein LarB [Coraliomargarita akajimensis]|uniref:1-(5-phosphoribosyl)-5-amino-4-imidazole-carboxylate (AIR) carboxylase n=1 Tax=Coraliomargarita akajimensis (strain DSM 45221 / IAM 15411 / JCM 23193 / KCTC 12865 / 04OKA010-24) TaxID=583355 RepID=D5EKJ7_CORAD|nr:nickel pincer cofactor biosynthesis protein LarB [Coraliomargarita akajimensis]ADE54904.1 1-(5-phosphoribosyl)-5-amino-4-imidazole- carboxylate (AIR) carboxylase [Coraliomargarita akajimensis DSM 45221]